MKMVVIESPFAGRGGNPLSRWIDNRLNIRYARTCLAHSASLGESPYASHLLLTQVLNDRRPEDRKIGIDCGLEMHLRCDSVAFYTDRGWSRGMNAAVEHARKIGARIEYRTVNNFNPTMVQEAVLQMPLTPPVDWRRGELKFVPEPPEPTTIEKGGVPRPDPSMPFP